MSKDIMQQCIDALEKNFPKRNALRVHCNIADDIDA